MIELSGLWESTDKNGNLVLSGNLGNARLVIFKNTYKEAENQPDFKLYLDKKKEKPDAG